MCLMQSPGTEVTFGEGHEVQEMHGFGIGIDVHALFIAVCVMVRRNLLVFMYEAEFTTAWDSLLKAKEWCMSVILNCSSPIPDIKSYHYTLEATSTYHIPVVMAWEGKP